jgi:DnaJ-class molecular chaperone
MSDMVKIETYTEVIIEREPDFWIVECRHCRGTGQKYPAYGGKSGKRKHKCPTCGGTGANKITVPSGEDLYKCKHCRGTGQKYPKYGGKSGKRKHKCPTCGGKGVLSLESPRIKCSHCEGSGQKYPKYGGKAGKRKHKCPTCSGAGSNHIDKV